MRLTMRALLTFAFCLTITMTAYAQKQRNHPQANVAGVYEKFTVGQGSGDLEGMRVVIVAAGGGYHAIMQVAQGGAEDPAPEFFPVKVTGMNIEINTATQKFTGKVTAAGLSIRSEGEPPTLLPRKSCTAYFNAKP